MTDTHAAFTEWVGRQKPGRTPEAQDALDDAVDALEDILEGARSLAEQGEPEKPSERIHQLIHDLTDPGECWFDHHGGCQEHGYLTLQPGEKCPHAEARELLAEWAVPGTTNEREQA